MALRQSLLTFRCGTSGVLQDKSVWKAAVEQVGAVLGEGAISETSNDFQNGRLSVLVNTSLCWLVITCI